MDYVADHICDQLITLSHSVMCSGVALHVYRDQVVCHAVKSDPVMLQRMSPSCVLFRTGAPMLVSRNALSQLPMTPLCGGGACDRRSQLCIIPQASQHATFAIRCYPICKTLPSLQDATFPTRCYPPCKMAPSLKDATSS